MIEAHLQERSGATARSNCTYCHFMFPFRTYCHLMLQGALDGQNKGH